MKLRELTIKEQPLASTGQGAPNKGGWCSKTGAVQKVGQGAKMVPAKMGAKGGTGGMMAKGLDKLNGGALTGNIKQIAVCQNNFNYTCRHYSSRNKFMMLVKQAEAGAKNNTTTSSDVQSMDVEGKDDYEAKKKALQ